MNIRYIYDNGKIKVCNENGDIKTLDYRDNIDQVLITENIIEQMELEYQKLTEKLSKYSFNISFKKLTKSIFVLSSIPIILIVFPLIFGFINLTEVPLLGYIGAIGMPSVLSLFLTYQYNKNKNTKNAIEAQINFLKQNLSSESQKLNKLKKEKTKENEVIQVYVSKRVDDICELKRLRNLLLMFYNYGYYFDKYQKHMEKGRLFTKLNKQYSEEEISIFEENINNGPTLVK